ncbi:MAG TPA: hypothetical protein VJ787_10945 [Thermoleophilia bacterium]|nr:hypothetical protein [Thermoleophilia bacterium]
MAAVMSDIPAMYADHHVVELQRFLLDVPGVRAVCASGALGVVEIVVGAQHTSAQAPERRLVPADNPRSWT